MKLLVIDDEFSLCNSLKEFFSNKGWEVFIATNGEEGVSIVKEKKPDIILLDIIMSGRSGIYILEQIKKINNEAKVIMMTAIKDETAIETSKKSGACDYVTKPFSLKELEKILSKNL